MSCSTCIKIDCLELNEFDVSQLNSSYQFTNQPYQFVLNCPQGYTCLDGSMPRIITIPAGTFNFSVPESWINDPSKNTGPYAPPIQNPPFDPSNPANVTPEAEAESEASNPPQLTKTIRLNCSTGCGDSVVPLIAIIPVGCTPAQLQSIVNGLMAQCARAKADCQNLNTNPKPVRNQSGAGILFYTSYAQATCPSPKVGITGYNGDAGERAVCSNDVIQVSGAPPSNTQPSLLSPPNNDLYSPIAVVNGQNLNQALADAKSRVQQYADDIFNQLESSGQIKCGWKNNPQCATSMCLDWLNLPPTTRCVPKGIVVSEISQQDADDKAKAIAQTNADAARNCFKNAGNVLVCADAACQAEKAVSLQRCTPANTYVTQLNNPTYQQWLDAVQANNVLASNAAMAQAQAQLPPYCNAQPFKHVFFTIPYGGSYPADGVKTVASSSGGQDVCSCSVATVDASKDPPFVTQGRRATFSYIGPAVNCSLTITLSGAGYNWNLAFACLVDGGVVGSGSWGAGTTTDTITFTVPACLTSKTIVFNFLVTYGGDYYVGNATGTGTFTFT